MLPCQQYLTYLWDKVLKYCSTHIIFVASLTVYHVLCLLPLTSGKSSHLHYISWYIQGHVPSGTHHHNGMYIRWWWSYISGISRLFSAKSRIVNVFDFVGHLVLNFQYNLYNWIEKLIHPTQKDFSVYFQSLKPHKCPVLTLSLKICIIQHPTFSNREGQARMLVIICSLFAHGLTLELMPRTGQTGRTRIKKRIHSTQCKRVIKDLQNSQKWWIVKVLKYTHTFLF